MRVSGPIVDSDSHIEEPAQVWEYLDEQYQARRPQIVDMKGVPGVRHIDSFWLVDGQTYPKPWGHKASIMGTPITSSFAKGKIFSVESQSLLDVDARIKDLDRFGIDIQVNFPTFFLEPVTEDVLYEAALMRAYNTWIAERSGRYPDRLKFAAILPLRTPELAVAEVKRAKELGAACVTSFGTVGGKMLHDPSLDPVWAECERQGLPIGIHIGWSHPGLQESGDTVFASQIIGITMPLFLGFFSFIGGGILDRHPNLKVAFLEAGADWLPYMLQRMDHYYNADKHFDWEGLPQRKPSEYFKDGNIYVTCEGDEALLPEVVKWVGEDQILISGDIPHAEDRENSMEEIKERTDISDSLKEKILTKNGMRFFGF